MRDLLIFARWLMLRKPTRAEWFRWYRDYLRTGYWLDFIAWRKHGLLGHLLGWDRCAKCGTRVGPLHTHHTTYAILWREWLPWNWGRVETLCEACHRKEHK